MEPNNNKLNKILLSALTLLVLLALALLVKSKLPVAPVKQVENIVPMNHVTYQGHDIEYPKTWSMEPPVEHSYCGSSEYCESQVAKNGGLSIKLHYPGGNQYDVIYIGGHRWLGDGCLGEYSFCLVTKYNETNNILVWTLSKNKEVLDVIKDIAIKWESSSDTYVYNAHGFIIEFPSGFDPIWNYSEGGPSESMFLPTKEYGVLTHSWNASVFSSYDTISSVDRKIGNATFSVYPGGGTTSYLIKLGDNGYNFSGKNPLEIEKLIRTFKLKPASTIIHTPVSYETYNYTNHGISIELPKGFVTTEEQSEQYPYVNISLPFGLLKYYSDSTNMKNLSQCSDPISKIGDYTFTTGADDVSSYYCFKQGKVGYEFSTDSKSDLEKELKTFKFTGWKPEAPIDTSNWKVGSVGDVSFEYPDDFDLAVQQEEAHPGTGYTNFYFLAKHGEKENRIEFGGFFGANVFECQENGYAQRPSSDTDYAIHCVPPSKLGKNSDEFIFTYSNDPEFLRIFDKIIETIK